jgi:hypothetical protein
MVETKRDLTIKEVLGILTGTFGFLFTTIAKGVAPLDAAIIACIIAALGFLYAWFGVKQVSITQLGDVLLSILKIAADKTKDIASKMLEIEVLIKKEMEVLNLSWETLNESADGSLKTTADVAKAVADVAAALPGKIGDVAKTAAMVISQLTATPTPTPTTEPPK